MGASSNSTVIEFYQDFITLLKEKRALLIEDGFDLLFPSEIEELDKRITANEQTLSRILEAKNGR